MDVTNYSKWKMEGGSPIYSPYEMALVLDAYARLPLSILTSGGFDPIHPGHISCIEEASNLKVGRYTNNRRDNAVATKLIVVVNGDEFLRQKKGQPFMPLKARCQVVSMLQHVDYVVPFNPSRLGDMTVCEAIEIIQPDIFAKGGDRVATNTPEAETCERHSIEAVYGLGDSKYWSSFTLLNCWEEFILRKQN